MKCVRCKKELSEEEFSINLKTGRYYSYCDECREKRNEYRKRNKEKIKEYKKRYYESNKELLRNGMKEYKKKNIKELKRKRKEYYNKNNERFREYQKLYRKNIKRKHNLVLDKDEKSSIIMFIN